MTGEADAMGGRAYIGEQSRRMQQRRKNLERRQNAAIEEKSALLKNIEQAAPLKLHQLPYHTNRLALLRNVSVCYGDVPVCSGVTFSVEQGDRIALRAAWKKLTWVLCVVFTLLWARIAAVFANRAQPKTLNRATGVVLVVLGLVLMGFQLLA